MYVDISWYQSLLLLNNFLNTGIVIFIIINKDLSIPKHDEAVDGLGLGVQIVVEGINQQLHL